MTDIHNQGFFGQKSAFIVSTNKKEEPFIFIRCLKRKVDGSWEKPSRKEGKVIKLSIEELIEILDILSKNKNEWKTIHRFKEEMTNISIRWDGKLEGHWFKINEYNRLIKWPQSEVLKRLLKHILEEKIEFATSGKIEFVASELINNSVKDNFLSNETQLALEISDTLEKVKGNKNITEIKAVIKKCTEKALLLQFDIGKEVWTPRSIIYSKYDDKELSNEQKFLIESWILNRNNIKI